MHLRRCEKLREPASGRPGVLTIHVFSPPDAVPLERGPGERQEHLPWPNYGFARR